MTALSIEEYIGIVVVAALLALVALYGALNLAAVIGKSHRHENDHTHEEEKEP